MDLISYNVNRQINRQHSPVHTYYRDSSYHASRQHKYRKLITV